MPLRIELPAHTARTQLLGAGRWAGAGMTRDPSEMEMSGERGNSETTAWTDILAPKRTCVALRFFSCALRFCLILAP